MAEINLDEITKKGKAMFLAYDQGLEHGPDDFNDKNLDPNYIIKIAREGKFTGLVFQKGLAEKYNNEIIKSGIPLILKLNGKTNLVKGDPISRQLATVDEAIGLNAKAVGFTVYIGSRYESLMFQEFEKIQREAHKKNLPVILWAYPRGKSIEKKNKAKLMSYACRIGLELGADIVKIRYDGNYNDLLNAVKNAGKTKVVIAGGIKKNEKLLLKQVSEIIGSKGIGIAVGRNVWQSKDPLETAKKIRKQIWK